MNISVFEQNLKYSQNYYAKYREYWQTVLSTGIGTIDLPLPKKGKIGKGTQYITRCELAAETATLIKKIARDDRIGFFAIMVSIFEAFNHKCAREEHNVLTYLIPPISESAGQDFVILQTPINEGDSIKQLITNTATAISAAYNYQDYPLSLIDNRFRNANFNIADVVNISFSFTTLHTGVVKHSAIHFQFTELKEGKLEISLFADSNFIEKNDADILLQCYASLLERISDILNYNLTDTAFLTDAVQLEFMQQQFTTKLLKDETVKERFEAISLSHSDNIAVVYDGVEITYSQLNIKANLLAAEMKNQGVTDTDSILVLMEMSIDVIIAMLASIKLGVPYIPLDIDTPSDRINYIIEDSGAKYIITNQSKSESVALLPIKKVFVENRPQDCIQTNPQTVIAGDDPLYIIYTSGTTGKPKGVVVNHQNIENYVNWFTSFAYVNEKDRAMLVSSFSFDLGYTSVYSTLLNGAELHLLNKEQYSNVPKMLKYISENSITFFKLTPSLFKLITTDSHFENHNLSSLRLVVLGGEKLQIDDIIAFKSTYKDCLFVNHYGPTETTIGTIAKYISENEYSTFTEHSILGKAITNNQVFILNDRGEMMPIGTLGEVVVGGLGVSNGYLHRKKLTAEKFLRIPKLSETVMYKTGDLGRLLPSGEFEFIGRIDNQVKIRGYRVELAEVEQCIKKYNGITDVVLVPYNRNGSLFLSAYYVSNQNITSKLLREYLSSQLPEYMIPSYFTGIEKVPVTLNGKVDVEALPEPSVDLSDRVVKLPRNDVEMQLSVIWQDALGINEELSIDDNFFDLGGDSILAIQLSSVMKSKGLSVEVKDIMQNPTIQELANIAGIGVSQAVVNQSSISGGVPLSPIQKRFFSRLGSQNHWNQSIVLRSKTPVDIAVLDEAFSFIVKRHDMLRACYIGGGICKEQIIRKEEQKKQAYEFSVNEIESNITSDTIEKIGDTLQSSFDITSGKIIHFAVVQNHREQYIIMIAHHLIVDGVSWRILVSELDTICQGNMQALLLKTNSYRDWVNWLGSYMDTFKSDLSYWNGTLEISGMTDNQPTQNGLFKKTQTQTAVIESEVTRSLLTTANHSYNTKIDELLVTAFLMAVNATLKYPTVVVNLEGHGRDTFGANIDISRTVGWFTSIFPFEISFEKLSTTEQAIRHIKEKLRNIPHNGVSYGALRYMSDTQIKSIDSSICFNYLGQFDNSFDTPTFEFCNFSSGQAIGGLVNQQYGLHLNLAVINDKIQISATYSPNSFAESTITLLLDCFVCKVDEINNSCLSLKEMKPTPSDFSFVDISIDELDTIIEKHKTADGRNNIETIYPLIPFQEVMYHQITTYNKAIQPYYHNRIFDINAPINLNALQEAIDCVVKKYDALRMAIEKTQSGKDVTIVLKNIPVSITYEDICEMPSDEQEQYFNAFHLADTQNNYVDNQFMRIFLFKLSDAKHRVLWSNSHIIIDGWSRMVILKDFFQALQTIKSGDIPIENHTRPFKDYVKWLYNRDLEAHNEHWGKYMEGYEPKYLFGKVPSISDGVYFLRKTNYVICEEKAGRLSEIAKSNNITVGIIIQCAIGLVLQKACDSDDITFGGVVSGRPTDLEGIAHMVGPFINIIPFRVNNKTTNTFISLAKKCHTDSLEADEYSYYFYKDTHTPNDFTSLVAFENYPIDDNVKKVFFSGDIISNLIFTDRVGTNAVFLVFPDKTISFTLACNPKLITVDQQNYMIEELDKVINNIVDSNGFFNLTEDDMDCFSTNQ